MDRLRNLLREGRALLGISMDETQEEQILTFVHLLHETNKRYNLTGFATQEDILIDGILDSLTALTLQGVFTGARNLIDVGTGGGIPGIPLKIVLPHLQVTLLEATEKKCRFLESAIHLLRLAHTEVLWGRAETLAHDPARRERYDLATARALGTLPEVLELTVPFLRPGGKALYYKSQNVEHEILKATRALQVLETTIVTCHKVPVPFRSRTTVLVLAEKRALTPLQYPRRPGIPKKRPL